MNTDTSGIGDALNRSGKYASNVIRIILAILLGVAVIGAIVNGNLQSSHHWGILWLFCAFLAVVCIVFRQSVCLIYRRLCSSNIAIGLLFALLTILQISAFVAIAGFMKYDAGEVFSGVFAKDKSDINVYLSIWQNNIPLYVFEHAIGTMLGLDGGLWSLRCFVVIGCISYDAGFLLLAMSMKKLYGREAAVATGLLSFMLLGLTNQMYQFYTTALSWPFTCLGIYLYAIHRFIRTVKGSIGVGIAFGMTVVCGYIIRPSSVVYCIALVLIEVAKICGGFAMLRDNWRRILAGLLAVVCGAGLAAGAYTIVRDANIRDLALDESKNATMAQYLAYGITGDGMGDVESRERIAATQTVDERKEISLEIWKTRIEELGVVDYSQFLMKKHVMETSDGSFRLFMPHIEEEYSDNSVKNLLQNIWYSSGQYSRTTMFCMQIVYLLVLTGALLGTCMSRDVFSVFLMLSLLGWHAFLLLFEGARTGYTVQAFPVMIPLAVLGLRHMVHMAQAVSATNQIRSSMI